MAPAIAADAKIPCTTPQQLREELDTLTWALEPEEKEDTWEKFERAIIRFAAVTRGGGYKMTELFVEGVGRKGVGPKLAKCFVQMLSDRGRLSGVSTDLLQTMAPRLSLNFKPLVNLYLEPLVQLLGRPNKVFLKRAEKCLMTIISHCHLTAMLPELRTGLNDNAATCRRYCASGMEKIVKEWPMEMWSERLLTLLEESVRKMATDKDPEVRQTGKRVWALFNEIWPERVDGFSAPLTPTIRRYLGLSANGEPTKPKPKAARPIAALRPVSALSSESSHGTSSHQAPGPATKPQHHRVNALASRPARGAVLPLAAEAGPSRRRSPRKEPEPTHAQREEEEEHRAVRPALTWSTTTGPSRPHMDIAAPGMLSRHGRSASHSVLSSGAALLVTDEPQRHNPLSRPVRPVLPTYQSAPGEMGEAAPPRRFAPPARIVRPLNADEDEPVLRGPARNPMTMFSKRPGPLGQAPRRVVTAPTIPEDPIAKTSASGCNRAGHDAQQENDHHEPVEVSHSHNSQHTDNAFNSPAPAQAVAIDSPLMPTLIRSNSGDLRVIDDEEDDDMIDLKEEAYPPSPTVCVDKEEVEVAAGIELPDSPIREHKELEDELDNEGKQEDVDLHADKLPNGEEKPALPPAIEQPAEDPVPQASNEKDACVDDLDRVLEPAHEEIASSGHAIDNHVDSDAKPPARTINKAKDAANVIAVKPKVLSAAPPARKPPVPLARSGTARPASGPTRTVSAPISRRPFKPTSLTAATAASAARAASVSKPAPAPAVVSRTAVATSTDAPTRPGPTAGTRARVVSAQIVKPDKVEPKPTNKPPIPPMARAAPTRTVSGPKKPAVTSQVTLPPVKKERVVRKAPLPSFRPTRTNAASSDKPAAGLKASTSSTVGGRARVRPEMIKLPESPARLKASEVPLPPSPHEVPLPLTPHSRAASIVSSAARHKPSPLNVEVNRPRVRADSLASHPNSPITLAPPKPLSPLLTTIETEDTDMPLAPMPVPDFALGSLASLGFEPALDPFVSALATQPTPMSKASTDADISDSEDEDGDDFGRVTFKSHSSAQASSAHTRTSSPARSIREAGAGSPMRSVNAFAPRSDVSTPQKSAASLLAKLEGSEKGMNMAMSFTPGERKALSVKDANTPGNMGSSESEWDASA